ncbi:Sorting and assembly machinery component 50-like protein [Heterocephalus glaber]|uniref:Sorting and assembly machinery component 50 homolog n=1 Tax=Heterocephalus glaber TaxID=10181 RepID=G5BKH2_HETGA|nr:Sorting and assembly machinery component 50-like protein [Heterocephalus glaber]
MSLSLEPLPASGPDFGGLGEEAEFLEVEPEAKQEILENKDVVVQHVHFDGLGRTKDDIIICEIGEVFKAKNLIEVMRKSHEAREKLLRLGIFRQVDVLIDTCQGDDALPNGLDVTFEVTELRRLTGSYNTMVGNNEGSMVLGLKLPNLLGRAEKVTFQFSYGTKETSYGLSFFKPQPGNFERNFSVNLYKVTGQFPWSSLRETDRGVSAEYSFPIWRTSHSVKWEGVWRELGCLSRTASFAVRKESGHSLKSSLSHTMVIDSRNSSILPRRGALLKVNQELAGYTGGDVSFLKEEFELQLNKQLVLDSVVCASLWGGMLVPIGDKPSSIADRFYLGGPTSVRGFSMHSIGPQSEGDYLGGEAYWAGGLHLYTPLPFRPGQGGFGELFRTHFFLNAGNLCNLNYGEGPRAHIRKLAECIRWSYGAGIVLRLGNIARLELNYCIPMGVQRGDRVRSCPKGGLGLCSSITALRPPCQARVFGRAGDTACCQACVCWLRSQEATSVGVQGHEWLSGHHTQSDSVCVHQLSDLGHLLAPKTPVYGDNGEGRILYAANSRSCEEQNFWRLARACPRRGRLSRPRSCVSHVSTRGVSLGRRLADFAAVEDGRGNPGGSLRPALGSLPTGGEPGFVLSHLGLTRPRKRSCTPGMRVPITVSPVLHSPGVCALGRMECPHALSLAACVHVIFYLMMVPKHRSSETQEVPGFHTCEGRAALAPRGHAVGHRGRNSQSRPSTVRSSVRCTFPQDEAGPGDASCPWISSSLRKWMCSSRWQGLAILAGAP